MYKCSACVMSVVACKSYLHGYVRVHGFQCRYYSLHPWNTKGGLPGILLVLSYNNLLSSVNRCALSSTAMPFFSSCFMRGVGVGRVLLCAHLFHIRFVFALYLYSHVMYASPITCRYACP